MTDPRLLNIRGLIEPEQGQRLAQLASHVPDWATIVEIGSHTGLSTCYMAMLSQAHVFAIDPWPNPRPGSLDDPFGLETGDAVFEEFKRNVDSLDLGPWITPIRAKGHDVAPMWVAPVGLVFIDAVHEEEPVRQDVYDWAPKIYSGGWLALHDYTADPDHPYHGVAKVADALEATGLWDVASLVGSLWTAQKR